MPKLSPGAAAVLTPAARLGGSISPRSKRYSRYIDMASARFSGACAIVSPVDMQAGGVGAVATYPPSSSLSMFTTMAYLFTAGPSPGCTHVNNG